MGVGDPGPLVVPWDDEHRYALASDIEEGLERLVDQRLRHPRPVEEVPAVNDHIHLPGQGRRQSLPMVGQEVVPPPSALDSGTDREVEPQVGIGQKQHPDG